MLLPREVLILLKQNRQGVEDQQSQYIAVLELKIILELNLTIPSPDSRNYNQHRSGLLHQSKKCSNA